MKDFDLRDYGAVGNGTMDDSVAVQAAVTAAAAGKGRVRISGGVFAIGQTIHVPSYSTLEWDNGALIKARHGFVGRAVFQLHKVNHVSFEQPHIDGNKADNSDNGAPGCYGILGESSSVIRIRGGHIRNIPARRTATGEFILTGSGDGIYLNGDDRTGANPCEHWFIRETLLTDCDRNGLSVVSGVSSRFEGLIIQNSGHAGIDIEPDHLQQRCGNLMLRDCLVSKNNKFGIVIVSVLGPEANSSITVIGNHVDDNGIGVLVRKFATVQFVGNSIRHNKSWNLALENSSPVSLVGNTFDSTHDRRVSIKETEVQESNNLYWKAPPPG